MSTDGRQILKLSGSDWSLCPTEPGTGNPETFSKAGFVSQEQISALVPGDVHADLKRCGRLEEIYYDLNSKQVKWVAPKEWWYRKEFELDKSWGGRFSRLFFHGVDYACKVWLNGIYLGRHEGQLTTFNFDVSDMVRLDAKNILLVMIEAAPENIVGKLFSQQGYGQPHQDAHDEIAKTLKHWKTSTVTGWDWGTPIWSAGISQDVELIGSKQLQLNQPVVIPELAPPYKTAKLNITQNFTAKQKGKIKLSARVNCTSDEHGEVVFKDVLEVDIGEERKDFLIDIKNPKLWWPNGYGEQNLYSLKVTAEDLETAAVLDSVMVDFGIRHLEILKNPPADDNKIYIDYYPVNDLEYAGPVEKEVEEITESPKFLVRINGRLVFLKGGNWLPADLLYGTVDLAKYEHLIRSAGGANYNAFRIWGGGLIEKQEFYNLCDKYGILVLQEMPHAGRRPPENDEALENEADELRQVLPLLMNHPSVIRYGFGNELYINQDNSKQVKQFLEICREIDPSRPAYGPSPVTAAQRHGPHWFYFEDGYDIFNTGHPTDAGPDNPVEWDEYGAAGMSCKKTLERIMPVENTWPIDSEDGNWIWHKAFKAYREDRWLSRQNYESVFGVLPDLETEIRVSQFAQAEGLRYENQSHRRKMWHRSGCLAWTYNEPWPNAAHGSIVEYFGRPKMAYYYVKQSYAMVDISAEYDSICCRAGEKLDVNFWVTSDYDKPLSGREVCIDYLNLNGSLLHQSKQELQIAPQTSKQVSQSDYVVDSKLSGQVLLVRAAIKDINDSIESQHWYTFGVVDLQCDQPLEATPLKALINSEKTELSINAYDLKDCESSNSPMLELPIEITNTGSSIALFVKVDITRAAEQEYYFSDNFFCLPGGESKVINLCFSKRQRNTIKSKIEIPAEGWNTEPVSCKKITE